MKLRVSFVGRTKQYLGPGPQVVTGGLDLWEESSQHVLLHVVLHCIAYIHLYSSIVDDTPQLLAQSNSCPYLGQAHTPLNERGIHIGVYLIYVSSRMNINV